jgi:uncharacterized cupredoxin-like copper-binding protein
MGHKLGKSVLALATSLACACAMAQDRIYINVNGVLIEHDIVEPQILDGRVMVPLRGVLERLGVVVEWDNQAKLVIARRGPTRITLGINETFGTVNNEIVRLDAPARLVNGRTMVPLRYLAEGLGAYVFWDAAERTVVMTTRAESPVSPVPPPAQVPIILDVSVRNGTFAPNQLRVAPGQQVTLRITNQDQIAHGLILEVPGQSVALPTAIQPGASATLTFIAPEQPGIYNFYSSVDGQRQQGLQGTIIVG